jgi:methylated-DNA-protein-cysteine methyltransferase-like protein
VQEFTRNVIDVIKNIPEGKVSTYGAIAAMAGNPRGARQVVRVLNTQSKKHGLPWHRVINSKGKIAINDPDGAEQQKILLMGEGVEVSDTLTINLKRFNWINLN